MKRCNFFFLMLMLLASVTLFAQTTPPTDQELLSQFNALPQAQKFSSLRLIYNIQIAIPELLFPDYGAVLDKDSGKLIVYPIDAVSVLKFSGLQFKITFPVLEYPEFYKPPSLSWERYIVYPLVCGAAGLLGSVMAGDQNGAHYAISVGVGLAAGLVVAILVR